MDVHNEARQLRRFFILGQPNVTLEILPAWVYLPLSTEVPQLEK